MKSRTGTLASLAVVMGLMGVVGTAEASPVTGTIRFQVSDSSGVFWSNEIGIDGGMSYKVRAIAEWTDDATPSVGFAGATFQQLDLIGATTDDTYNVAGAFRKQGTPETWSLQAGTGLSLGGRKIDNITPTNNVNMGQLPVMLPGSPPNPNFSAANPLVLFQMDCVYAFSHQGDITFTGTWVQLGMPTPTNQFSVYITTTGSSRKPVQEAVVIPALVRYVGPTPGTAGAFGFAAVAVGRRRRR